MFTASSRHCVRPESLILSSALAATMSLACLGADGPKSDELAGASAQSAGCPPIVPLEPSTMGSWELLPDLSEVFVVHAAVLHTGKVLLFAGEVEFLELPHVSAVWDPETGIQTIQDFGGDDLFCGGHAQLADGRILVNGGSDQPGQGIHATNVFDPVTETWTKKQDMVYGRWYPTTLTLADGRIITFSGLNRNHQVTREVEIYDVEADEWTELPDSADRRLEIYPSMHLLPNGTIVYSGTRWNAERGWPNPPRTAIFDLATSTWTEAGFHIEGDRSEGFSVLIPEVTPGREPWRVQVVGGYGDMDSAEWMDLSDPEPSWEALPNMRFGRNNANGVILLNGTVLYCSGINGWKWGNPPDTLDAEIFDPQTADWTVGAAMEFPAQYHSVAVLLPDGRVLKTGGHDAAPKATIHEMEVYSPPYLFRGERPTLTRAPEAIGWGRQFEVESPNVSELTRVALVRLSTITHHTNTDQRYLSLEWTPTGEDTFLATAPANGHVAPPGYYMLTVLNECGVPSVSRIVRIGIIPCVADITGDDVVGFDDLLAVLAAWGNEGGPEDLDGSGTVDFGDILIVLAAWGPCE